MVSSRRGVGMPTGPERAGGHMRGKGSVVCVAAVLWGGTALAPTASRAVAA